MNKKALILVDLQNDFCPGGRLGVAEGDQLMALANSLQPHFDNVVATQDWHPADHVSFAENHPGAKVGEVVDINHIPQIMWPTHCVQGSDGAAFHPDLNVKHIDKVIQKGIDSNIDSYSGFFDNAHRRTTGLSDYLKTCDVDVVYIMGLATDYCVKYTVLDALSLGLEVYLIKDGCRGVDLNPGDVDKALQEMQHAGAKLVTSDEISTARAS